MEIDKKTFCAAAWFQVRNDHANGEYRVCCEIDHTKSKFSGDKSFSWPKSTPNDFINSEYVQYLRSELNNGNKLPECGKCWRKENAGGKSLRQVSNDTVTNNQGNNLENTWIKNYFKNKTDFISNLVLSADLKTTNICNFACTMCEPMDSSKLYTKWLKNKNEPAVRKLLSLKPKNYLDEVKSVYMDKNNRYELLEYFLLMKPKHLKILGGEPLMDEKMFQVLEKFPHKSNIKILFVTNGSQNLSNVSERLKDYKDVNYTISLEGKNDIQDYIREGSNWNQIENNILEYQAKYPNNQVSVNCVVQALNIFHIPEFVNWCRKQSIALTLSILDEPSFMGLSSIPPKLKTDILKNLHNMNWNRSEMYNNDSNMADISKILQQIEFDEKNFYDLKMYIQWYDPQEKWKDIIPEWKPYLE